MYTRTHKHRTFFFLVLAPLDGFQINSLLHHLPQRAHVAQVVDPLDSHFYCCVDLSLCCEAPNAKPDRRVGHVFVYAQSSENIAWLERGAGAGRAGRDRNVLLFDKYIYTYSLYLKFGAFFHGGREGGEGIEYGQPKPLYSRCYLS